MPLYAVSLYDARSGCGRASGHVQLPGAYRWVSSIDRAGVLAAVRSRPKSILTDIRPPCGPPGNSSERPFAAFKASKREDTPTGFLVASFDHIAK